MRKQAIRLWHALRRAGMLLVAGRHRSAVGLIQRIEGEAADRHRNDGLGALDDPEYARLLARARVRLHRALEASLPDAPLLDAGDIEMLEAFARVGFGPLTVILFGQERIGAKQIAARLLVRDGVPRVQLGVAVMDEWGELTFRAESSPPPLTRRMA